MHSFFPGTRKPKRRSESLGPRVAAKIVERGVKKVVRETGASVKYAASEADLTDRLRPRYPRPPRRPKYKDYRPYQPKVWKI